MFPTSWLRSRKLARHSRSQDKGSRRRSALALELLEERLTPANNITILTGGLTAIPDGATTLADTADYMIDPVAITSAGSVALRANNDIVFQSAVNKSTSGELLAEASRSISVTADLITADSDLTLNANQGATPTARNFSGIDINGATVQVIGRGTLTLHGRSGDDLIVGGDGRDLLIGGMGADRLVGNADEDILIASAYGGDEAALSAIMAEWTSTRDYATRTANLEGCGSDTRLNGDVFLKTDGDEATVGDENAVDVLTGSAGADWFFANLDATQRDKITDLSVSEFAEDLDFILGV